jgi:hypothetical protein
MDRRNFITGIGTLIAGIAIEEAMPFGRVWSFPKEIQIANATSSLLVGRNAFFNSEFSQDIRLYGGALLQRRRPLWKFYYEYTRSPDVPITRDHPIL